jgi:conjugative transfer signal peptidase TraF
MAGPCPGREMRAAFSSVARTLVVSGSCICLMSILGIAGVRLNLSLSLPVGLYVTSKAPQAPLVEFCPAEPAASLAVARRYRAPGNCPDGAAPLLKPIVAGPGDLVQMTPMGLAVNRTLLPNTRPRSTDAHGRLMVPWPYGTYSVASGTVWVASTFNCHSFDSRYFGPISIQSIRHHLRPLLTE